MKGAENIISALKICVPKADTEKSKKRMIITVGFLL